MTPSIALFLNSYLIINLGRMRSPNLFSNLPLPQRIIAALFDLKFWCEFNVTLTSFVKNSVEILIVIALYLLISSVKTEVFIITMFSYSWMWFISPLV